MTRQQDRGNRVLLWLLAIVAIPAIHIGTALLSSEGPDRIDRILQQEYALLGFDDKQNGKARSLVDRAIRSGYQVAWEETGLRQATEGGDSGFAGRLLASAWPGVQAWILTLELLGMRLAVLLLALPFWLLVLLLATLDGLVGWYIRRTVAGRESAFIYHRTKQAFFQTGWLALFLYLATPIAIDPLWVFPLWYLASALLLRFTVAYFKKYL